MSRTVSDEAPKEEPVQVALPGQDAEQPKGKQRQPRKRRVRRFLRRPTVRVIGALVGAFLIWVCFSIGQALVAPSGGSASAKLAEWARDHYLGPVVTFGEWLTYQPPKVGGKPSFSLTIPKGASAAGTGKDSKGANHSHKGITPIIPASLSSLAGRPLPGEGQWRVLETVKGVPAIYSTFLRQSATYSSYVSAIASMDQRLVKFYLHPGSEDPGPGNWGANSNPSIPPGKRTDLLATLNSGFKLDASKGGFYLNGKYDGSLVTGAASVVYYKNGTVKIGEWGRDFGMTSQVAAVRQNLKLIVDHGQVPDSVDSNVEAGWGYTLGGGYYVWRSGIGITRDGRVTFVYGPALDVRQLATLLQHAGAVEGMQLDINPFWTTYEYYQAGHRPSDPTPVNLLPSQQGAADRYYSTWSRDFTAVYAR
jgi:Phosphodiester glycosidase